MNIKNMIHFNMALHHDLSRSSSLSSPSSHHDYRSSSHYGSRSHYDCHLLLSTFRTSRSSLSVPFSKRQLKPKGVCFNSQSTPLGRSYGYPYVQSLRGFSSRSYDLQFNHTLPIYSTKQMVSAGNLEYDYPVYWSKPLMEEGIDVAGATPQTRRDKKDKLLKDLSDKYVRLFNLILKRPDDYNLHMYFCNVRLKLDKHLILQMGMNYVYRFTYCEKDGAKCYPPRPVRQ